MNKSRKEGGQPDRRKKDQEIVYGVASVNAIDRRCEDDNKN